ncbi:ATP-binding protein [Aquincola sp. MAHUQ-54]|uniref:ATP-binding protein n=1 Tax=Aquincola agrisoli TaxID=3119538 RepID=A0AAW9QGK4_9BURK
MNPQAEARAALWQAALAAQGLALDGPDIAALALRYPLSAMRIRAAAAAVAWAHPPVDDAAALAAALDDEAHARANEALGGVASRVLRRHGWDTLVLPEVTQRQLREVADAIRVREQVYGDWGLARRTGRSAGLAVLFCGASGTGKTMAAAVVSQACGLPLYRVDLAGVVSKYIGETEQNLDRVFRAAARSSAVLLFDEADALMGRRSEVKDAHDRYANLEVAYLLQKLEEHPGVVILASNLPKNLDAAFARRMHYTVEFARPAPPLRERLWRGMLPPALPRADDIDYAYLAERFDVTGGEIQAATLDAAFLAASAGTALSMEHLLHALARRQAQQGHAAGARYSGAARR